MATPYQQLRQEICSVLGEPVAWVSHARTTRHPLPWRPARVLLALTPTHVAVFFAGDAAAPFTAPPFRRVALAQVKSVGRRRIRAVDACGHVHWFRLDPQEPSARGFLAQPRTYRTR